MGGQYPKTALVAGARGIVGGNLVARLRARADWSVIGIARAQDEEHAEGYRHLALDLTDRTQCERIGPECGEVTHVFYAARAARPNLAEESAANVGMLRNLLDVVLPHARRLDHVTLVHGTKWYGSHLGPYRTPAREDDPRHAGANFYFDQEDDVAQAQQGRSWHWSTVRPHIVCGLSVGYPFNFITTLAAYGSLCRERGQPFDFPGTPACFNSVSQVTDAELLADAMIWTAQDPRCDNQAFNIINGDYFRWCNVWPLFADFFGLKPGGPTGASLAATMQGAEEVWAAMARKHGLRALPLGSLANWSFADFVFRADWDDMSSVVKAWQAGFHAAVDSEEMFLRYLRRLRAQRFIP